MERILILFIFLFFAAAASSFIAGLLYKKKLLQFFFVLIMAVISTYLIAFKYNVLPLDVSEQLSVIKESQEISNFLHLSKHDGKDARKFIESNFHLVNLDYSGKYCDPPTRVRIATFLDSVNHLPDSLIDLVILDVFFNQPDTADTDLCIKMSGLAKKHKIIAAYDERYSTDQSLYAMLGDDGSLAYANYTPAYGMYFEDELVRQYAQPLGCNLPYLAYKRLNKYPETDTQYRLFNIISTPFFVTHHGNTQYGFSRFIPKLFPETNEIIEDYPANNKDNAKPDWYCMYNAQEMFRITLDRSNTDSLNYNSVNNVNAGIPYNIIVLGNFKDTTHDMHATAFGNFQGSMLMLNVIYDLFEQDHLKAFSYLLALFTGFILFYLLIIIQSFYMADLKHAQKDSRFEKMIYKYVVPGFIADFVHVIFIEKAHYWYLLFFYLYLYNAYGRITNILIILIFSEIMEKFFKKYVHHAKEKASLSLQKDKTA